MSILQSLFGREKKADLKSIIEQGAFLVDVRTPGEFAGGHVKGSVNIPLDKIVSNLQTFKDKKNIIVFCQSGNRSSQAKSLLENNGIRPVVNGGTWNYVKQFVN